MEKSDEIWWMKHVRKFDEQKLWRMELGFAHADKNKLLWSYNVLSRVKSCKFHNSVQELAS